METYQEVIKRWRNTAADNSAAALQIALSAKTFEDAKHAKLQADAWTVIRFDLDRLAADFRVLEAL